MPALSPTMTKGGVTSWLVSEGQKVSAGDVLAEIQTDKATMEMESMEDGFVAKILIEAGREDIDVGTPLLVMVEDEKDVASFKEYVGGKGGGDDSGGSFNDSGSEAEETRKEEKSAHTKRAHPIPWPAEELLQALARIQTTQLPGGAV